MWSRTDQALETLYNSDAARVRDDREVRVRSDQKAARLYLASLQLMPSSRRLKLEEENRSAAGLWRHLLSLRVRGLSEVLRRLREATLRSLPRESHPSRRQPKHTMGTFFLVSRMDATSES